MIEYFCGELTVKKIEYVAIDVNGVGYKLNISLKTFEELVNLNEKEKLYVHTHVKEDEISYFGFKRNNERELFRALISISGVGPKLAVAILSTYSCSEIIDIVLENNVNLFKKVPGLGIKKAQKIILDLESKVKKMIQTDANDHVISLMEKNKLVSETSNTALLIMKDEITMALESLGYVNPNISDWIKDDELKDIKDVGAAIKIILQKILNKK